MPSAVHSMFHGSFTVPERTVGFGYPMRLRISSTDSSVMRPLIIASSLMAAE